MHTYICVCVYACVFCVVCVYPIMCRANAVWLLRFAGEIQQEGDGGDIGCCGQILKIVSIIIIFFTFPVAICMCIKVRTTGGGGGVHRMYR